MIRTKGTRVYKRLRSVDHHKTMLNIPGVVARIEYDPNRTAFLSLIMYANGICVYHLASQGIQIGAATRSHYGNYSKQYL